MNQRGRAARLRAVTVLALAAALLLSILPVAGADDSPIKLLGRLPLPKEVNEPGRDTQAEVFLVLPQHRRMYLKFTRGSDIVLREYDLGPKIPQPLREATIASGQEIGPFYPFSRNKTAYDARRDRILVLAIASGDAAGCPDDPLCTSGSGSPGFVKLFGFDRKTLKRTGVVNLAASAPGFTPQGMSYSAADDLIYMVGDVNPVGYVNPGDFLQGNNPRTFPVAVAALEPDSGRMRWMKVVPECPVLMTTQFLGAAVYRSASTSSLYFACSQTGGNTTPPYPEPSGIARVWIDPEATLAQAASFESEYFPISGSYATGGGISGVAAFDQATDRFFMQSQSETLPGVWVFDGRLSAWVGFIGALDLTIAYAGINQLTGRYYVGGSTYTIPVDGRHTPVPQGRVVDIPAIQSQLYIDDPTGRIMVAAQHPKTQRLEWLVYQDRTPVALPPRSIEYDELTTDLKEGPETISTYSGTLAGYGVQVVLAGGTGAIVDPYCVDVQDFGCSSFRQALRDAFNLSPSPGPRSLFAARVPSLDLRNVGAAAGARAFAPDPVTEGEYETIVEAVAAQLRRGEEGGDDPVKAQLAWPHLGTFCIDAGGDAKNDATSAQGGTAKVSCDLAKQRATAETSFATVAVEGLSVASSSFEAESHRDPKLGIVTSATAVARGVRLDVPGAAVVDIARVVTKSSTAAHGAKGTAKATWERILEGVVVRDASGAVLFECAAASECDPRSALAAMNTVLKSRMHVSLPQPELIQTPGGAYAAVQEREGDFYNGLVANDEPSKAVPGLEVIVYNDTKLKSRVLVQLAAIQASSIYGITPLSAVEPPPPPGPPLALPSLAPVPPPIVHGPTIIPPAGPSAPVTRLATSPVFLIRSPKDAFLFGLTLLLLGGAIAAAWRRRVLMRHLSGSA